jgi:ribonuclease HI
MRYMVCLLFPSSNNVAEYEALINGLRIAIGLGVRWLDVQGDSQLVISQVMKESSYHNPKMAAYCQEVCRLEDKFDGLELNHIPRWLNEATNKLAKMASARESVSTGVFASDQHQPLIRYKEPEQADNGLPISSLGARANNQHPALGSGPNTPMDPPDPEVMEIDKDPPTMPDPLPD